MGRKNNPHIVWKRQETSPGEGEQHGQASSPIDAYARGERKDRELTAIEVKILQLAADGFTNKEIAYEFGTKMSTVKNHLTMIYTKLGVRRRTEAVVKAYQTGILGLEEES